MALITNEYGNEGRYGSSGEIIIRPKWRYVFITAFLPVLVYCTTLVLWMMFRSAGPWLFWAVTGILGYCMLSIAWSFLSIYCTSWILTDDQLCFKRGVIARRIDYMELYRVTDYVMRESVMERLLGLSLFFIVSTDSSSPVMRIYGIPHISSLQKVIRMRVEKQRKEKRIYEISNQ